MTSVPPPAPVWQPQPAAPSPASERTSTTGRTVAAVLLGVGGLVAGLVLWLVAAERYDDGVRSLARAPVGCDTTLDFAEAGEYIVFVETRGEFPDVRGDCDLEGRFDLAGASAPSAEVRLVDPGGDDVTLQSFRGREDYDRAGSTGTSIARVTIAETGDHVVRVTSSSDTAFAVAIGRDPASGVSTLRLVAVAVALVGLGLAIVVAVTGRRTAPPPPPPPAPEPVPWTGQVPSGPPPMTPPSGPPSWAPPPPAPPAPPNPWPGSQ